MAGTTPSVNYSTYINEVTHQQYMRKVWDETKKVRALFEKAEANGAIETNENPGSYMEWKVKLGEFQDAHRVDLEARTFARKQHYATATAGWAFLEATATLSERDLILNRGDNAIVKLQDRTIKDLVADFKKRVNSRFLTENAGVGSAVGQSANSATIPVQGLPTMFHVDATPLVYNTATTLTTSLGPRVQPDGNYCNLAMEPGGISAVDDQVTGSWSPLLVNTGYKWDGTTDGTWAADALEVANYMMTHQSYGNTAEDRPDLGIMTRTMYSQFKELLQAKQRLIIDDSPKSPDAGMHPRVYLNFEGAMFCFDEDQASGLFSLLNTNQMKIEVVPAGLKRGQDGNFAGHSDELFNLTTKYDIHQGADLAVATFVTQMICHPKYQGCAYGWVNS